MSDNRAKGGFDTDMIGPRYPSGEGRGAYSFGWSATTRPMISGSHWLSFKKPANAFFPGADVGQEFQEAFDATFRKGGDALVGSIINSDHLAIVAVVGVHSNFLEEFEPLTDLQDAVHRK